MKKFLLFLTMILSTTMATSEMPTLSYSLGMSQPWTHLLEVEVSLSGLPSSDREIDFILPAWRTGRYLIFDFAGGVLEFSAADGNGKPLAWEKTDKTTWRVQHRGASSVRVRYKVYANEFALRTRGLSDDGAFLDGAAAFMFVERYRKIPLTLSVIPFKDWHVTTGLDEAAGTRGVFTAPSYDHLVDCPLFVGNQKDFTFTVEGKRHALSIFGSGSYDSAAMIDGISALIKTNKEFWGNIPYQRFVFMLHLWSQGGGGTEHINSTIMGARPFALANPGSYQSFFGLVSHEYFHTWNIKQIRPRGISPYNWVKENYTKELWIAEGTTSYYGTLIMIRAGLSSSQRFIEQLPGQIQSDRQRPGNRIQSVSESSFDAWVKYWRGNQQAYNSESDYYDKGSDVSLLLDLEIRNRSKNAASLDDVMRALYKRFPWNASGYTVDDFQKICEEYAGGSLDQFFEDYVHGTKPLEWERALSYAGFAVKANDEKKVWLGAVTRDQGERTRIVQVIAGSPAYDAGLDINDEVIALNGFRVRTEDLQARIGERKEGNVVRMTVMRNDMLREFPVTLRNNPVPSYSVTKVSNPSPLQKSIYESWLSAKWE